MNRTGRLGAARWAGAFALMLIAGASAQAVTHLPKLVAGIITNADGSAPSVSDITFSAHIQSRPTETITQASGFVYLTTSDGATWYQFDCGNFASQWAAGDVLIISMQNSSNHQAVLVQSALVAGPALQLNIQLQIGLALTSPVGGEQWDGGTTHNIAWTSIGNPGAGVKLELSTDHGGTWSTIVVAAANANGGNTYEWTVPNTPSAQCLVRATSTANAQYTSTSAADFTIVFVQPVGSLTVTLGPAGAIAAGAQWSVDGGATWKNSGDTVNGLAVGSQTVSFKAITGWNSPAGEQVAIANAQTTTATGTYVQQTGSVTVTLAPAEAVTAGARWSVDGGATWKNSGDTVSGLTLGAHTVSYNTISGWNSPASATATVTYNNTTTATGTYVQQTGSLTVTLAPAEAVTAGARWSVDGGAWQISGATISGLTLGAHTVSYNTITGWNSPASATATITYNNTATATGTYVQQTGSLTVTLAPPDAVTAGARWSVDGGATWQISGATVSGLTIGAHTITYNTITGWNSPAGAQGTIANGQTAAATGTYVQQTGSLTVTLGPAGAVGAQWNVDGGATWHNSGDVVSGLALGAHTINYNTIPGWNSPASAQATITYNNTTTATGTYVLQVGSLQVTLTPPAAVSAGAKWSLDGGTTWNASGATISALVPGSQTVSFKAVSGWNSPASQTATITSGATTTATGDYVQFASFSLAAGYNLISLPFSDSGWATAENLSSHITGCQAVWKWDAALQQWSGHIPSTPTNNFALVPGAAYLLSTGAATTIPIPGTSWAAPSNSLSIGYNLISLPKSRESLANAEALAGGITSCTAIWRWDNATQTWSGHIPGTPTNNFSVAVGEAYLVYVTAASNWP